MTYDDWKTTDDTPEPEPAWRCDECGHHGADDDSCGCPCCTDPGEEDYLIGKKIERGWA